MIDLSSYLEKFRRAGEPIDVVGAASDSSIALVETALNVHLRGQYREFLTSYGGLRVLEVPLNGIYEDDPLEETAGTLFGDTKRLREEFGLPNQYLVLKVSEDEYFVCLDLSVEREPVVVSVDPRSNFHRTLLNKCFDDYLIEDLDAALEAIK
jgi:SMI1-KNR4 cell-wall